MGDEGGISCPMEQKKRASERRKCEGDKVCLLGVTEPLKPRRPDKAEPPSGNGVCMWLWWNDSVHQALGSFINPLCGERDKGSGRV